MPYVPMELDGHGRRRFSLSIPRVTSDAEAIRLIAGYKQFIWQEQFVIFTYYGTERCQCLTIVPFHHTKYGVFFDCSNCRYHASDLKPPDPKVLWALFQALAPGILTWGKRRPTECVHYRP